MIVSVSRRTDIPAFYSDWFFNRLKEGVVHSVNPFNRRQIGEISLRPEDVDCFVFWTKNPAPMLDRLDLLAGYNYYFQFTLTPYGRDAEPGLPDKRELLEVFRRLSAKLGRDRVVWRYDPVFLSGKYDMDFHAVAFRQLAESLHEYTDLCVISFVDLYAKISRNIRTLALFPLDELKMRQMAAMFSSIAAEYNLTLESCSEKIDLSDCGIRHGQCIDRRRLEKILGGRIDIGKDTNQRQECGCVQSVDIGQYNTCRHLCVYCYANVNARVVEACAAMHNPRSTILSGELRGDEKINRRKVEHLKIVKDADEKNTGYPGQLSLF